MNTRLKQRRSIKLTHTGFIIITVLHLYTLKTPFSVQPTTYSSALEKIGESLMNSNDTVKLRQETSDTSVNAKT